MQRRLLLSLALFIVALAIIGCAEEEASPEQKWETSAHADAEAAAFTNWNDPDPAEISISCAKCHSTHGYRDFLGDDGSEPGVVNQPAAVGTTIECEACHNDTASAKTSAVMPSGKSIEDLGRESNCVECHQGRASGVQIREAIGGKAQDTVDSELSFINIHNKAAGPTQHGTLAMGGHEYSGRTYAARYDHTPEFTTCIECHDAHALTVRVESCGACHAGVDSAADLSSIRVTGTDYDLDGDVSEGIAAEIDSLLSLLLRRMNLYALGSEGVELLQYEDRRPYFFDEAGEEYSTWTPRLLQAAFNYHYVAKEPGGYAHHSRYQLQLIYDSLEDLGTDTRLLTRPGN